MIINVTVKLGLVRLVLTNNGIQVLESDYNLTTVGENGNE